MPNRRQTLALAAACAVPLGARAQEKWPSRPIRIINPGAPGGTNDVLARYLAEPLAKLLGQSVIVEPRPGAGGIIGAQYVAQQPADGYTILTHHNGFVTAPLVSSNANYDPVRDFVPLSLQGSSPMILMAHPSMPATLPEFVAYARAHPGQLEWGTAALGGVGHLTTEVFNDRVGIKGMVMVPFSGSAPAIQALLGGQIKYLISSIAPSTNALAQDGRLRFLGVTTATRSPLLPKVPSLSEAAPGFASEAWYGFVARAGTPPDIVAKLADAIVAANAQPEIAEKYRAIGVVPKSGRSEFAAVIRRETDMWSAVVREKNIHLE